MNRPRILAVSLLVVSACVVSALACGDRSPDPSRVARPSPNASREKVSPVTDDDDGAKAKRKLHAGNRHDWVGAAHNRAIDEFRARLRRGEISHDMCNDLVAFMSAAERLPREHRGGSGGREQRGSLAKQWLRTSHFCANRLAQGGAGNSLLLVQSSDLSAATHGTLDQIQSAAASAATSGELATTLNGIVQYSAQLPNGESVIVDAAASVAQASMEYWEANLQATRHDYDNAYGGCIGRYASLEEAVSACLGLSGGGPAPTIHRGRNPVRLHLVQGVQVNCKGLNGKEIVHKDVGGAIGGGIAGFWAGTAGGPAAPASASAGALTGALLGGGGASIGEFSWQWARMIWCGLNGGRRPGTPIQPT